ncbi:hypothetical protein PTKIN_Ptkin09bG0227700 [Pterospermum kingtungense]
MELMPNKSAQDVLVASEALHGESNNIPFLEYPLNDLNQKRREGEAYRDALDLAGIVPSPLEQFEIVPLIDLKIGDLYFSFTNPSLFMLLTLSLFLLLLYFVTKKGGGKLVPNAWQSLVELIYDFVLNPINEQKTDTTTTVFTKTAGRHRVKTKRKAKPSTRHRRSTDKSDSREKKRMQLEPLPIGY